MKFLTNIAEVGQHVAINMTNSINVLKSHIEKSENLYISKLIGGLETADLTAAYIAANRNAENIIDADIKEAVLICQKIASNLGYLSAIPMLNVSMGSTGIKVIHSDESKSAFQWQVTEVKDSLQEIGFNGIEDLLELLESKPLVFDKYAASPEYQIQKQFLIKAAHDFNQHFNIGGSRFVFANICYLMKRIEDQVVKKIYGPDFFNILKTTTPTGKNAILVNEYIKPGIAILTGSKAIIERQVTFKNGVAQFNFKGDFENNQESAALTKFQIQDITNQLDIDGNEYLQSGIEYINKNLADFPDYTEPVIKKRFGKPNDRTQGIFKH